MASNQEKIHYLENSKSNQFWEIQICGVETKIRSGKIGFPGRKFPTKKHENPNKSKAFARRHINVKLVHGFEDLSEVGGHPLQKKPNLLKKRSSLKQVDGQDKPPWKQPIKKRESVKKLARQGSVILSKQKTLLAANVSNTVSAASSGSATESVKPKWRKPPKKQSTIRRVAKADSMANKAIMKKKLGKTASISRMSFENGSPKKIKLEPISFDGESSVDREIQMKKKQSSVQKLMTDYMSGSSQGLLTKPVTKLEKSFDGSPVPPPRKKLSTKQKVSLKESSAVKVKIKPPISKAKKNVVKKQKSLKKAISTVVASEKTTIGKNQQSLTKAVSRIVGDQTKVVDKTTGGAKGKQKKKPQTINKSGADVKVTKRKKQESSDEQIPEPGPSEPVSNSKTPSPKKSSNTTTKNIKEQEPSNNNQGSANKFPCKSPSKSAKKAPQKGSNLTVRLPGVRRALSWTRKKKLTKLPSKTRSIKKTASVKRALSNALLKDAILKKTSSGKKPLEKQKSVKKVKHKTLASEGIAGSPSKPNLTKKSSVKLSRTKEIVSEKSLKVPHLVKKNSSPKNASKQTKGAQKLSKKSSVGSVREEENKKQFETSTVDIKPSLSKKIPSKVHVVEEKSKKKVDVVHKNLPVSQDKSGKNLKRLKTQTSEKKFRGGKKINIKIVKTSKAKKSSVERKNSAKSESHSNKKSPNDAVETGMATSNAPSPKKSMKKSSGRAEKPTTSSPLKRTKSELGTAKTNISDSPRHSPVESGNIIPKTPVKKSKSVSNSFTDIKMSDCLTESSDRVKTSPLQKTSSTGKVNKRTAPCPNTPSPGKSSKPSLSHQPTLAVTDVSFPDFKLSKELPLSKQETLQLGEPSGSGSNTGPVAKSLSRMPSLTVGLDDVYIPARKDWPMCVRAPVSWRLLQKAADPTMSNTYALYVENSKCVFGDDSGRVYELDELGHVQRAHHLNVEVKVITKESGAIYVGCSSGVVYEISSGFPELIYQPPKEESEFTEVQGLSLYGGVLAISNVSGHVIAINHDGKLLWKKKSSGDGGWLLCVDESGVYHGHSDGVTKYSLYDGQITWNSCWSCDIFAGAQNDQYVYVADYTSVYKLGKSSGKTTATYEEEVSTCGCILSLAVGRGLVIAGGLNIICYDEASALPMYKFSLHDLNGFKPLGLQYHSGRLYCVGERGLYVIELTREAVMKAKNGLKQKAKDVVLKHPSMGPPPLIRKPTSVVKKRASHEVEVRCVHEGGSVRVKPVTSSFKKTWSCEFPVDLKEPGARYIISGLTPSTTGGFYRVEGEIKMLQK